MERAQVERSAPVCFRALFDPAGNLPSSRSMVLREADRISQRMICKQSVRRECLLDSHDLQWPAFCCREKPFVSCRHPIFSTLMKLVDPRARNGWPASKTTYCPGSTQCSSTHFSWIL